MTVTVIVFFRAVSAVGNEAIFSQAEKSPSCYPIIQNSDN